MRNDLVQLFLAVANQSLHAEEILVVPQAAATVMLVSKGYPGEYEKGKEIVGEWDISDSLVFHAGTMINPETGKTISDGGRVIAITSLGISMKEALVKSYKNAEKINFDGKNFRHDIGSDLLK